MESLSELKFEGLPNVMVARASTRRLREFWQLLAAPLLLFNAPNPCSRVAATRCLPFISKNQFGQPDCLLFPQDQRMVYVHTYGQQYRCITAGGPVSVLLALYKVDPFTYLR